MPAWPHASPLTKGCENGEATIKPATALLRTVREVQDQCAAALAALSPLGGGCAGMNEAATSGIARLTGKRRKCWTLRVMRCLALHPVR